MIILYPGYNFQSLVTDLTENEASEILSAYTALFHPAIFKRLGKIPQWESASGISTNTSVELIVVPYCCEPFLPQDFDNIGENNNVVIIRNLKSRAAIVNEIFSRFDISNNYCNEFVSNFYAIGTTALFVSLLAHHLHYMDSTNDSSVVQALQDIIDSVDVGGNDISQTGTTDSANIIETQNPVIDGNESVDGNTLELSESATDESNSHNLFRDAFERIAETKECYYPVSSYLLDLTLVVKSTLGESFRRFLLGREFVNLFLPASLLDLLPETEPATFKMLQSAASSGKAEFVVDDVSDIPLLLFPILEAADKILQGISIYRERLGISPAVYGRQRAGFAPFLPQILKLAGFKGVLYFAPLDGWYLKQRNQSKMIWRGVDGTKIDALIRYPIKCSTSKEFFNFADNYSELINSDSVPTAVFAAFPVAKTNKITGSDVAEVGLNNSCNNNLDGDDLDASEWYNDLRKMTNFTTQLGELVKLESYFATTSQTGSEELIAIENYITDEPSDIPFWLRIYRENLSRTVGSVFGTVSQLLDQSTADKSVSASVGSSVSAFVSAAGLSKANEQETNKRQGIAILNAWNFGRRVFVDVSDWSELPPVVSPIVFAGEKSGKKEIVVDVPPLGFVEIPATESPDADNSVESAQAGQKIQKGADQNVAKSSLTKVGLNIFGRIFGKRDKPLLISESEDKKAYFLQNEFFVAKVDSATGMLRSLLTGNYRYNRLSQQLGFRLPKALREVDSRRADDPNRGYASSVVDEIGIDVLGEVTGRIRICGRLVCDDGCEAAKFTEFITVRRFSRILEFKFAIEPIIEPSGDSAWDSYYAIRSAWHDRSLELRGSLGDSIYNVTTNRVLSPRIIDLRSDRRSLTFFSEGLPFHRRFGDRYLDTILIAKGDNKYDSEGNIVDGNNNILKSDKESSVLPDKLSEDLQRVVRRFRYGVGVDIRHPLASSFEFMLPKDDLVVPICSGGKLISRWFFRLDVANVIALHWEPLFDFMANSELETKNINNSDKKEPVGFKVYLLETEGLQTNSVLRSFKPVVSCCSINLLNEELQQLNINEAGVQINLHPHELLTLACFFRNEN
ncbi:MAG: hypothetical protein LBC74_01020 [Planctomycetaceae bacterium]|jgi:hypothetical protein|nr:hypothetical protein [Planctomycetaceae bacterium]